jgi:hypothetical protein
LSDCAADGSEAVELSKPAWNAEMSDPFKGSPPPQTKPAATSLRYAFGWFIVFCSYLLLLVYGGELDRIFNLWFLLVPLLLLPGVAIAICWLVFLGINIAKRRWRHVLTQTAAPFLAIAVFALLGAMGLSPERIRFAVNKHTYEAEIARLPQTGEPRFHKFDWGATGGAAAPNLFFTLVFDESDEIALPPEQRSPAWRGRVGGRICGRVPTCRLYESDEGTTVTVVKMSGHFFLVTELLQ